MYSPPYSLQVRGPLRHPISLPYAETVGQWADASLPSPLLVVGPLGIRVWQWFALVILVVVAWLIGWAVTRGVQSVLMRATRRSKVMWDDTMVRQLGGPMMFVVTIIAAAALLPALALAAAPLGGLHVALRIGFTIAFFWALWRSVDIGRQAVESSPWGRHAAASKSLVPLTARIGKIVVVALAVVVVLSSLGYPVASVIAGLGIGGLAVALAAQRTLENLFGAFALGVDRPFVEGDFVKIEDFLGTVETIGLRSTRIRTLDRTLITMPNGKLADMRLESYTARDRLRLSTILGLEYRTTPEQLREVLDGWEKVLRAQPKLWPDAVTVRFSEFAASSLNIEIMAWFLTSDWAEFQGIRQQVLLQFMEVVERAKTSFAFPTRTVHMAPPPAAA